MPEFIMRSATGVNISEFEMSCLFETPTEREGVCVCVCVCVCECMCMCVCVFFRTDAY